MYPTYDLSESQVQLRNDIKTFVDENLSTLNFHDWEWRDEPLDRVPWELVEAADEELNLKRLSLSEEFGGENASTLTTVMATEELSAGEMGFSILFETCWKVAEMIEKAGREPARSEYLEAYLEDPTHLMAMAATEPANGSHVWLDSSDYEPQLETTARKEGDEWVIDGTKRYISNGVEADTYIVFAQTDPDESMYNGSTAFIVPRSADGFEVTHEWEKIAQRMTNNGTLELDGVRVPEDHVIGLVNNARGTPISQVMVMKSILTAGAKSLGTARGAYESAFEYAHEREQFGATIIDHQSIGHQFADMQTKITAARSLIWQGARSIDQPGPVNPELGSMAKLFAADVSVEVCQQALETFGGAGIMLDSPAQKYLRDALSFLHSDGTQQIQRERIINQLTNPE